MKGVKSVGWDWEPELSPYGRSEWVLVRSWSVLITFVDDSTELLILPAGFRTDLASVFRLPLMFMLFGGRARRSAAVHDYLYSECGRSRAFADAVFFAAMRNEESTFVRYAMHLGVRLGGWLFYRGKNAD